MTQQQAACRMQLDVALSRFHAILDEHAAAPSQKVP